VTLDRVAPLTPETRLPLSVWTLTRHRFRITARVYSGRARLAKRAVSAARTSPGASDRAGRTRLEAVSGEIARLADLQHLDEQVDCYDDRADSEREEDERLGTAVASAEITIGMIGPTTKKTARSPGERGR
jgi:hypothetical protein